MENWLEGKQPPPSCYTDESGLHWYANGVGFKRVQNEHDPAPPRWHAKTKHPVTKGRVVFYLFTGMATMVGAVCLLFKLVELGVLVIV